MSRLLLFGLCVCGAVAMAVGVVLATAAEPPQELQPMPLRIFLRSGPKTHGPADNGLHDGPTFLKEWKPLLEARGAKVEGALRFPTAEELEQADVLVMFAADAGSILGEQRAYFEKFLRRGGGIVCFHDAVVTPKEPEWFATIVGGSWENGVAKYFEGENTYFVVNTQHPIVKDLANFKLTDEVYWDLHMMPEAHVLVAAMQPERRRGASQPATVPIGKLIPQVWTYQNHLEGGQAYRAFVDLMGHHFSTFAEAHARPLFLRGIAWAAKRDPDLLTTAEERAAVK